MAELFTNNATSTLAASLGGTSGDTSITVQTGDGAKFPNPGAGDFFRVTLFKKATGEVEICKCTARSGDVLTVIRGEEGTSIIAFNAGDIIELRPTAGFFSSLSVTSTNIQQDAFNYAADTGVADDYQVSLSPAPTAYTNGLAVRFLAANSNTGASTLQIDALGKKAIKIDGADLPAGTIKAGRLYEVIYNGTEWDFQTSITTDISGKMDKVPSAAAGNVAVFDSAGQVVDGGNLVVVVDATSRFLAPARGLVVTLASSSTINITADVLFVHDSSGGLKELNSVNFTIDTSVSGPGGLDTGSLVSGTYYYIWLIYDSSANNVSGVISLAEHSALPSVPSNYDYFGFCGFCRCRLTSPIIFDGFIQEGRDIYRSDSPSSTYSYLFYSGAGVLSRTTFGTTPYLVKDVDVVFGLNVDLSSSGTSGDVNIMTTIYSPTHSIDGYAGLSASIPSTSPNNSKYRTRQTLVIADTSSVTGSISFDHIEVATVPSGWFIILYETKLKLK